MNAVNYREHDYILMGHSLGGYLASNFALRYPEKLTKLFMVSAVGIKTKPEEFTVENVAARQPTATRSFMFRRMAGLWEWHISPFTFLRKAGYYGANRMLDGYVRRRLNLETEEEKVAFKDMLIQTSMRNISSEVCITMIL